MDTAEERDVFEWRCMHSLWFLLVRIAGDSVSRSVLVFDYALAEWLNVSVTSFSAVGIAFFVGQIISAFIGTLNDKYFNNSLEIFRFYRILSGILAILFGIPFALSLNFIESYLNTIILIAYLTFFCVLYSCAFIVSNNIEINIATDYNKPSNRGLIVSILSTSWTVTSLLYIVQGYAIDYSPSIMYFVLGGILCILPLIIVQLYFKHNININDNNNDNNNNNEESNNERLLFLLTPEWLLSNKQCSLVLLCTIIVSISTGSTDVIVNPILMNIYGLSTTESGYASLSMAAGEIIASLTLMKFSDKWGNYIMVSIAQIVRITVGIILFLMCILCNNDLNNIENSLWYFMALIMCWYFCWELFYVSQLFSIFDYVLTKYNTSKRVLLLMLTLALAIGRIIGIGLSALFWDYAPNHTMSVAYISILWIIVNITGSILYSIIYYRDKNNIDIAKPIVNDTINDNEHDPLKKSINED